MGVPCICHHQLYGGPTFELCHLNCANCKFLRKPKIVFVSQIVYNSPEKNQVLIYLFHFFCQCQVLRSHCGERYFKIFLTPEKG